MRMIWKMCKLITLKNQNKMGHENFIKSNCETEIVIYFRLKSLAALVQAAGRVMQRCGAANTRMANLETQILPSGATHATNTVNYK